MDSLTQAVLGATVGQAVAGRRLGRRAALWGAVAGTLPDLDVLAYPALDTAGELLFHRGVTHGLAFSFVAGPALGWLVWRGARWWAGRAPGRDSGPLGAWTAVWFWALLTHPLLDVFTVYGTQLLAPFSKRPFAVGSVFIIDPLYTVPLAACLGAALWGRQRGPHARRSWAVAGLAVSTAYLGWGLVAQGVAERAALRALADQGLRPTRTLTVAAPLTTVLWRTVAEVETPGGVVYVTGLRSLLDDGPGVRFDTTAAGLDRLAPYAGTRGAETLRWFSRGWLRVRPDGDGVRVSDLRFGRADGDLGPGNAPYLFTWRLGPDGLAPADRPGLPDGTLGALWGRILGRRAGPSAPARPGGGSPEAGGPAPNLPGSVSLTPSLFPPEP